MEALRALKKTWDYIYGILFIVEVDAKTLVHQSNPNLPRLVNRFLAWIRLFGFDIKHVSGTKHGGEDGSSRRVRAPHDIDPEDYHNSLPAPLYNTCSVN